VEQCHNVIMCPRVSGVKSHVRASCVAFVGSVGSS
jgi:hypothetical protein